MASSATDRFFHSLSAIAVILLWGVSVWNGTVLALMKAAWTHELADGTPLETRYTGLFVIDFPVALLVSFFYSGTNGQEPDYQIFLLNAYTTLQPAFIWLYVEASRKPRKLAWYESTVFFGLLWQVFGAAISLPLYFAQQLRQERRDEQRGDLKDHQLVCAIPVGFCVGAVFPLVIGMLPTWTGFGSRDARVHQLILAAWQPDPLWVSLVQSTIVVVMHSVGVGRVKDRCSAHMWAIFSYALGGIVSLAGHVFLLATVAASGLDPVRMFVPYMLKGPADTPDILVKGPWLFLQYDFLIIAISSLSWVYMLLLRLNRSDVGLPFVLTLPMLVGSVILGPGSVVALGLIWREVQFMSAPPKSGPVLGETVKAEWGGMFMGPS